MPFKDSRKIGRKLKTRVSLLLLVCYLAMPSASTDNDLSLTSVHTTDASLNMRHCGGHILLAENANDYETHVPAKFRSPAREAAVKRNGDIKVLKRVRTQLKVARNHFRSNREIIAWFYSDVNTVMPTNYHYEWLPAQSLVWYKKHVKKLDKDAKMFTLLPVLRDSLNNFSVTLEQMRQFSETQYMSNQTLRKRILDDLSKHLTAVLCEVETALLSVSSRHGWKIPDAAQAALADGPDWDSNPDHTTMLIQDWGVLTTYYRFLKDWLFISRRMVRDHVLQQDARPAAVAAGPAAVSAAFDGGRSSSPRVPCTRHRCKPSEHKHRDAPGSIT